MTTGLTHCVIGSGPAGVACATALLAKGVPVRMVDAGVTLEPERAAAVRALRSRVPSTWTQDELAPIKEGMDPTDKGVVLKRVFGSDFAYRGVEEHLGIESGQTGLKASLALGGLSNVWGAALLPYRAADVENWPFPIERLAPHYAAALEITGLAARNDGLRDLFPLHTRNFGELPFSVQSQQLWDRLEKSAPHLQGAGVRFGASRLAVKARRSPEDMGCVQCGLCMYGCPWGYIYNSASTIDALRAHPHFSYEPGVVVERVEESGDGVALTGFHPVTDEPWRAQADRVFLGAGVLPTAKIVLASRELYDTPRWILDSQYFLFPLLQLARSRGVETEELHTLSQIFLEILDPKISPHTVHLQLYSYNDLLPTAVRSGLGPLAWPWLVRRVVERMMIVQGYLHSDHSSRIRIELRKGAGRPQLLASPEPNPHTPKMVKSVLRKLARLAPKLRAIPVEPLLQIAAPGRGFHCGGTFPMRAHPEQLDTDMLGRVPGWNRVHLIDASVLPSIPATTITLSVMANAHRIATAACF